MWFWLKSVLVAGKVAGDVANFTDNQPFLRKLFTFEKYVFLIR